MSIYEYDEARHIRQEREAAWEDGQKDGFVKGEETKLKDQIKKKLAKGNSVSEIADALEEEESEIQRLITEMEKEEK